MDCTKKKDALKENVQNVHLSFTKMLLDESPDDQNTVIWSDEIKTELSEDNQKYYIWREKKNMVNNLKKYHCNTKMHGGGNIL